MRLPSAGKLPAPLSDEERRIISHIAFIGSCILSVLLCICLAAPMVAPSHAQRSLPERISSLEEQGVEHAEFRAEFVSIRTRQDQTMATLAEIRGFGSGILCIITLLTGANWLTLRKMR